MIFTLCLLLMLALFILILYKISQFYFNIQNIPLPSNRFIISVSINYSFFIIDNFFITIYNNSIFNFKLLRFFKMMAASKPTSY